jgi:small subunit ribosomal protein S8
MYTDLLTKIQNAQKAKKVTLKVPFSNLDLAVSELLAKHNFIGAVNKKGRMPKRVLEIDLKYIDEKGAISGVKFLSVPSRRLYAGYQAFRPVKQGYGIALVSTPKGVMTSLDAKRQKIGGQLLFEIW